MITQKMLDAAHAIALVESKGKIITEAQVMTVLNIGLPWRMGSIYDAANAACLDLSLVDMIIYAAISAMNINEKPTPA
jgi:hypothetical protein